ncbi:hypothetical protein [Luteimonas sp. SDU101]|uniref:hypothetical protein n=1 Tax=Luteimonas sp. SDU101 TaxID=3422593 RepID=UPI003EB81D41
MSNFSFPADRTARFKFVPTQDTTPAGLLEKITRPSDSADYRSDLVSDVLAWVDAFEIDLPDTGPASERRLAVWEMSRDIIGFILEISEEKFYICPPLMRYLWAEGASDQDTMSNWIDSFELAREAMDRFVSSRVLQELTEITQRTRGELLNPTPSRPFM